MVLHDRDTPTTDIMNRWKTGRACWIGRVSAPREEAGPSVLSIRGPSWFKVKPPLITATARMAKADQVGDRRKAISSSGRNPRNATGAAFWANTPAVAATSSAIRAAFSQAGAE